MISATLAGGKGVRLWPVSTEKKPKQLCDFYAGQGSGGTRANARGVGAGTSVGPGKFIKDHAAFTR